MNRKIICIVAVFFLYPCKGRSDSSLRQTTQNIEIPDISYSYKLRSKDLGDFGTYTVVNRTGSSALSIDKLKQFIHTNNVRSIDQLLESFSKDKEFGRMLSQFVLIFHSGSEEASAVKPSIPRVVMHADLLFLSFTARFKDSEQKIPNSHQEVLPLFYFNPVRMTFIPGLFSFKDGKVAYEDNPRSCASCHGDPAMPIWAPYSVWPGVYGMMDGQIFKVTERALRDISNLVLEAKNFTNFIHTRSNSDRYRFLRFHNPIVTNFGRPSYDEQEKVFKGYLTGSPNTFFTHHIYHLNYWRVLNEILNSHHYPQYRYAIMGALLDCENLDQFFPFTMPIAAKQKIREIATSHVSYLRYAEALINDIGGADVPIGISYNVELAEKHIPKIFGNLSFVLQKTDIDPQSWSLARYPESSGKSFIFNAGADNESDGSPLLLNKFLEKKLIGDAKQDCQEIARKSRELF